MVYLDGHSTTALDPRVFEVMKPYFMERYGNASQGLHRMNWEAQAGVERAREQIAALLGCHEKEIIFTSGATEANHLAILGLKSYLKSHNRSHILSIEIEHASILGPLEHMEKEGFSVEWVSVKNDGRVDLDDFRKKLTSQVGLVTIALANHEIGTIQEIGMLSKLARDAGALVHTDAVQAIGNVPFTVDSIGVDLLTLSAHKIHGPKGIGALYVRRKNPRVELSPLFWGGGQERGLRPGTPNTPGIVGMGEAARILKAEMGSEIRRVRALRDELWNGLKEQIPDLIRNGNEEHSLPQNLNVSVLGVDGAALFGRMSKIAVSNASACLNGNQDYSQVLTVLGVERELARASLRFGLGRFNTKEDIQVAIEEIKNLVQALRRMEEEFLEQTGVSHDHINR